MLVFCCYEVGGRGETKVSLISKLCVVGSEVWYTGYKHIVVDTCLLCCLVVSCVVVSCVVWCDRFLPCLQWSLLFLFLLLCCEALSCFIVCALTHQPFALHFFHHELSIFYISHQGSQNAHAARHRLHRYREHNSPHRQVTLLQRLS